MSAYYPVQSGASFMSGMMDAYNRAIGMQANIVQYEGQMKRQSKMDALTIENVHRSWQDQDVRQSMVADSTRLNVATAKATLAAQIQTAIESGSDPSIYDGILQSLNKIESNLDSYAIKKPQAGTLGGGVPYTTNQSAVQTTKPSLSRMAAAANEWLDPTDSTVRRSTGKGVFTEADMYEPSAGESPKTTPVAVSSVATPTPYASTGQLVNPETGKPGFKGQTKFWVPKPDESGYGWYDPRNSTWWKKDKDNGGWTQDENVKIPVVSENDKLALFKTVDENVKPLISKMKEVYDSDPDTYKSDKLVADLIQSHKTRIAGLVSEATTQGLTKGVQAKIDLMGQTRLLEAIDASDMPSDAKTRYKTMVEQTGKTLGYTSKTVDVDGVPTDITVGSNKDIHAKILTAKDDIIGKNVTTKKFSAEIAPTVSERFVSWFVDKIAIGPKIINSTIGFVGDVVLPGQPASQWADRANAELSRSVTPKFALENVQKIKDASGVLVDTLASGTDEDRVKLQEMASVYTIRDKQTGKIRSLDIISYPEDLAVYKSIFASEVEADFRLRVDNNLGPSKVEQTGKKVKQVGNLIYEGIGAIDEGIGAIDDIPGVSASIDKAEAYLEQKIGPDRWKRNTLTKYKPITPMNAPINPPIGFMSR